MIAAFVDVCLEALARLRRDGIVVNVFGRSIPVRAHELEYCDEIAAQNLRVNPAVAVQPFVDWVSAFG